MALAVRNLREFQRDQAPSPWVVRYAGMIPGGGVVLDVACGAGRNGRYLRAKGYRVVMLDRDITPVVDLSVDRHVELIATDLEAGRPWPLADRVFDGIVVTNYLYRPILQRLVRAVAPGGALIYETFARGNEVYGHPRNPDYLLEREELLIATRPELRVVAFEDVVLSEPRPAAIQRIAAVRDN
jgi:SAM-dependent methyltransferase